MSCLSSSYRSGKDAVKWSSTLPKVKRVSARSSQNIENPHCSIPWLCHQTMMYSTTCLLLQAERPNCLSWLNLVSRLFVHRLCCDSRSQSAETRLLSTTAAVFAIQAVQVIFAIQTVQIVLRVTDNCLHFESHQSLYRVSPLARILTWWHELQTQMYDCRCVCNVSKWSFNMDGHIWLGEGQVDVSQITATTHDDLKFKDSCESHYLVDVIQGSGMPLSQLWSAQQCSHNWSRSWLENMRLTWPCLSPVTTRLSLVGWNCMHVHRLECNLSTAASTW